MSDQASYQAALNEWREAWEDFRWAEAPFIDYHVLKLRAAEEKLSLILRVMREDWPPTTVTTRPAPPSARRRGVG